MTTTKPPATLAMGAGTVAFALVVGGLLYAIQPATPTRQNTITPEPAAAPAEVTTNAPSAPAEQVSTEPAGQPAESAPTPAQQQSAAPAPTADEPANTPPATEPPPPSEPPTLPPVVLTGTTVVREPSADSPGAGVVYCQYTWSNGTVTTGSRMNYSTNEGRGVTVTPDC